MESYQQFDSTLFLWLISLHEHPRASEWLIWWNNRYGWLILKSNVIYLIRHLKMKFSKNIDNESQSKSVAITGCRGTNSFNKWVTLVKTYWWKEFHAIWCNQIILRNNFRPRLINCFKQLSNLHKMDQASNFKDYWNERQISLLCQRTMELLLNTIW